MTEDDLKRFVKNHAVQSKISDQAVVADFHGEKLIFIQGFPMTRKSFYNLSSKAIFGNGLKLKPALWDALNTETKALCQGLNIPLAEGKEAHSVVEAIQKELNWTKETVASGKVFEWIKKIEQMLHE